MSKKRQFLLFSERCSGSNVVEALALRNFGFKPCWAHGYKHWPKVGVDWQSVRMPLIVVTREALGYFTSLHRKPWHAAPALRNLDFNDFIRSEWWNVYDKECRVYPGDPKYLQERLEERDPHSGERFANVCRMRSSKLRLMRDALIGAAGPKLHVDFGNLHSDQREIIANLATLFDQPKPRKPKLVVDYKGSGGWRRKLFNRVTYGHFAYPSRVKPRIWSAEDHAWLENNLDLDVEEFFGYGKDAGGIVNAIGSE